MNEHEIMELLYKSACAAKEKGESPYAAAIVKNDELVCLTCNTINSEKNIIAHAEINAIKVACLALNTMNLENCILYCSCEPCPMCLSACHWAGIKEICFGAYIIDSYNHGHNEILKSSTELIDYLGLEIVTKGGILRERFVKLLSK